MLVMGEVGGTNRDLTEVTLQKKKKKPKLDINTAVSRSKMIQPVFLARDSESHQ